MIGELIVQRAAQMGLTLPDNAAERFTRYFDMLVEANKTTNLARGLEDEAEAADRHFVDSLTPLLAVDFPKNASVIDVGSGAGFPGLPLAIARPDLKITLMDSLGKRVNFLQSVIDELGLNARAVHARCEEAAKPGEHREKYDFATARAVAAMNTLSEWLSPFVKKGGHIVVLKGPSLEEEMAAAGRALQEMRLVAEKTDTIVPPGRDWDHRILVMKKTGNVAAKYPRKPGEASRKPL